MAFGTGVGSTGTGRSVDGMGTVAGSGTGGAGTGTVGTGMGFGGAVSAGAGCRVSASSEASIPGGSAEALTAMSTALLAQQLPPLSKFDGDPGVGENRETIKEWLEQFEMIAEVCRWDSKAKLVNMVTRLRGEAYAFYKSCSLQQRGSYEAMTSALTKRFTPVRIQAVESGLFHERKQRERESVDSYVQALRGLFKKAYPSAQRGSPEAESMGRAVLASQFASGLLPAIKSKVAGSDGDPAG